MKRLLLMMVMVVMAVLTSFAQDLKPKQDPSSEKWGYADTNGQWVIQPIYNKAWDFYNGKAKVFKNGKYGVVKPNGKYALKLKYNDMYSYKGSYLVPDVLIGDAGYFYFYKEQPGTDKLKKTGLRECKIKEVPGGKILMGEDRSFGGGPWGLYYDPNGPIMEEGFISYTENSDELSFTYADGKVKKYDKVEQRRKETEAYYKKISGGADYTCPIKDYDGIKGFFFSKNGITELALADGTRTGQKIKADRVLPTTSSDKYFIVKNGKYGLMKMNDDSCKIIIPCEADSVQAILRGDRLSDHLYHAYKNGKCGVWELNYEKQLFPYNFDKLILISDYQEDYWYARNNGKWGAYENNGKCVVPLVYEDIWFDVLGKWRVKKNGKWGIVDEDGKILIPFKFGSIWSIDTNKLTGYSSFRTPLYYFKDNENQDGNSGIVNKFGKVIFRWDNGNSEFVRFYNDYLIVKKGNKYGAIWCNTGKLVIPFVMDFVPGEDDFAGTNRYRILMGKEKGRRATLYVYGPNGKLIVSKVFHDLNLNLYNMERFVQAYLM